MNLNDIHRLKEDIAKKFFLNCQHTTAILFRTDRHDTIRWCSACGSMEMGGNFGWTPPVIHAILSSRMEIPEA